MKIRNKIRLGVVGIIIVVGVVGMIGFNTVQGMQERGSVLIASSTFMKYVRFSRESAYRYLFVKGEQEIWHLREQFKHQHGQALIWIRALRYGTASSEFQSIYPVDEQRTGALELGKLLVPYYPSIARKAKAMEGLLEEEFHRALTVVMSARDQQLTTLADFKRIYPEEKVKRDTIRKAVTGLGNQRVHEAFMNMNKLGNETLYQYRDRLHADEWVESIQNVENVMIEEFDQSFPVDALNHFQNYKTAATEISDLMVQISRTESSIDQNLNFANAIIFKLGANRFELDQAVHQLMEKKTREGLQFIVFVIVSALLLSVGLGWILSRSITRPIETLRSVASQIGRGNFRTQIEMSTRDELGDLAHSFNQMSLHLQETTVSKSFVDSIIQCMQEALFVIDRYEKIKLVNHAALKMLEYKEDEILTISLDKIFEKDKQGKESGFRSWSSGALVSSMEANMRTQSGKVIPVLLSISTMVDGGEQRGTIFMARDITSRKQFESRLIRAQKMESVGRLAASVAHEVKNPLATVQMGLDFLSTSLKPNGNADQTLVLDDMKKAIVRADRILRGLLDFSAWKKVEMREMDLNAIILESLNLIRPQLLKSQIRVNNDLTPNLPRAQFNEGTMQQVFINLITNSMHAMKGQGQLIIRTDVRTVIEEDLEPERGFAKSDFISIGDAVLMAEILDTGGGVPKEKLSRIFDPFFTTKPTGEGTGLGLSVVQKILEMHRGLITVGNRTDGTQGTIATLLFKI